MTARLATFALLVLAACEEGPSAQRCHLGREKEIFRSPSQRLRAIALAAGRDGRLFAAWSDEDGLRTAILDARGRVLHGPHRNTSSAPGSLEAVSEGAGYRLGALVPADLFAGGGGARVHEADAEGRIVSTRTAGPAGAYSRRISITRGAVAWHDGGPGTFLVRASTASRAVEVARGAMGALSPAIAAAPDGSFGIAWAELGAAGTSIEVPVKFRRLDAKLDPLGPAVTVARVVIEGADPALVWHDGGFTIAYRDVRADAGRHAGYYVARVGERGDSRIARSNGPSGPDLARCHGIHAGATVRTYQHELLLGFNRFQANGEKRGGELQIFSDRVHFGSVEIECLPIGWALLYGEEDERGARLLFDDVTCTD